MAVGAGLRAARRHAWTGTYARRLTRAAPVNTRADLARELRPTEPARHDGPQGRGAFVPRRSTRLFPPHRQAATRLPKAPCCGRRSGAAAGWSAWCEGYCRSEAGIHDIV